MYASGPARAVQQLLSVRLGQYGGDLVLVMTVILPLVGARIRARRRALDATLVRDASWTSNLVKGRRHAYPAGLLFWACSSSSGGLPCSSEPARSIPTHSRTPGVCGRCCWSRSDLADPRSDVAGLLGTAWRRSSSGGGRRCARIGHELDRQCRRMRRLRFRHRPALRATRLIQRPDGGAVRSGLRLARPDGRAGRRLADRRGVPGRATHAELSRRPSRASLPDGSGCAASRGPSRSRGTAPRPRAEFERELGDARSPVRSSHR